MTGQTKQRRAWRELTDQEWERIAPLIPPPMRQGKRKRVTDRQMVDALLYREYTKCAWSKVPGLKDAHLVVVKRYTRWRDDGTLARIFEELDRMELLPEEEQLAPEPEMGTQKPEQEPEWWEVTDRQWDYLAGMLPSEPERIGQSARYKTNRQILNVLLYREYTNCPWRELPKEFGPWRTIYNRYVKWKEDGYLDKLFYEMRSLDILSRDKYRRAERDEGSEESGADWWEVTDQQWEGLASIFPAEDSNRRGKKTKSDRQMLNAILCKLRTRCIWVDLPEKYGSWRTVIERYRKWRGDGTLRLVFEALGEPWQLLEEEPEKQPEKTAPELERTPEWWELTDEQWTQVAPLLGPEQPGGRSRSNRQMLNALLYREYTNCPWRDLPREFGAWRTVHERYSRWKREGELEQVFAKLKELGVISEEKYRLGRRDNWGDSIRDWWEVTDEQWVRIAPLFPIGGPGKRGRRGKDNRQVLNAILCRYYNATPWLELPKKYGSWRTVIQYYIKWRDDGTLDRVFGALGHK